SWAYFNAVFMSHLAFACMRLRIAPDSNRVMWLLHYAGEDLHPRLVPSDFMIGTKHDSHAHTGEKMPGLAGLMRGRVGMAGLRLLLYPCCRVSISGLAEHAVAHPH
ncbi:hypothetical protein, partial [Pseudomonas aeruginosa]